MIQTVAHRLTVWTHHRQIHLGYDVGQDPLDRDGIGDDGVDMGDRLTVMSKGEELVDPETGLSLGSTDSALGDIEVIQVAEKFSVAQWVSLAQAPNRGDRVVSQAPRPTIEFADKWKPPR